MNQADGSRHFDWLAVQPVVPAADAEGDRAAHAGRYPGRDGLAIHDLGDGDRSGARVEQTPENNGTVAGRPACSGVGDVGQNVDAARWGGHRLGDRLGHWGRSDGEVVALCVQQMAANSSAYRRASTGSSSVTTIVATPANGTSAKGKPPRTVAASTPGSRSISRARSIAIFRGDGHVVTIAWLGTMSGSLVWAIANRVPC